MKQRGLTFPSVLACLLLSVAAVLPFQPWNQARSSPCAFEITVESDQAGLVQLYYDIGRGMNEPDSALQAIVAGSPALLRFTLPYGRFQALRLDPLDRDARMTLSGARVVDGTGQTLVAFAPAQFQSPLEIKSLEVRDGNLHIEMTPGATDPHLSIALGAPFSIPRPPLWKEVATVFAAALAGVFIVGWMWRSESIRLGAVAGSAWASACASPGRALALVALLGTLGANYPVVFAGRSFVSPNLGVALLYGQSPWLPGFQSGEAGDAHKADVGALLWHHLPLSVIERQAVLRDGELPLWNRYDSTGVPLLGQGQSFFGDPLHVIPILANGVSWAWDLKFLLAKWLFACGVGLCVWRLFRHLPTALLVTASVSFLGFFVYRIDHPAVFGFCYSPWILYAWIRCTEARSTRSLVIWLAALIGANWTEMNSGTAKEAYVLLIMMNFSGLCMVLLSERSPREKARLLAGLVAAGALFAMVSSPIWYTFYRALKASYTSYNTAEAFQIQPGMFIGLFDEAFYRPFQFQSGVINPSANIFVLIGILWAAVCWRSLVADRRALALAVSTVPSLALVFGALPPDLVARVPFLGNILHVDNTFSCVLIVTFAVLCGFGWREAWDRMASADGRTEAATVVALLAVIYAAYLGTAQTVLRSFYAAFTWGRNIKLEPFIHGYGLSLILGAVVFLWALGRMRRRGTATPAMLICAFVALGAFHWREAFQVGEGFADYVVRPAKRTDLFAKSPTIEALLGHKDSPARVIGFHNDLLPGWSIVYGIEGISGPDALMNPYYREFMSAAGINRIWDWRYIVEPVEVARFKPVFDLLDVRDYLGYHLGTNRPGKEVDEVLSADMDTYESKSVWPRAFFTDSVAVYRDLGQYASWIYAGDGRPFAGIQLSDWVNLVPAPKVSGDLGKRKITAAESYHLTTNTTAFTVNASGPGFIVLTEAYEKDNFQATVNGKRVPYLRINHAFKGVYVDSAGTYEVKFAYWPRGLSTALIISAVGFGLIALALLKAVLGRRGEPAAG